MNTHPVNAPVTLVTGGSSGIGLATAHALAQKGHRLAIVARDADRLARAEEELRAAGAEVLTIEGDMGDPAWEGAILHATTERFGRLDHLVHAAGYAPLADLASSDHALCREVFMVNTLGPIELTRRAAEVFRSQRDADDGWGGSVVAISSYASADPFPGFLAYAGAKAAVNVMTSVLADELEPIGVRAYSIAPAAVETPMLRSIFDTETVPEEACLDPADVARLVVSCIEGDPGIPSGATRFIKRTDAGVRVTEQPI
ncbi:MAG: SDR family oxidoreductase [Planctomycetota bacterium]